MKYGLQDHKMIRESFEKMTELLKSIDNNLRKINDRENLRDQKEKKKQEASIFAMTSRMNR